MKPLYACTVCLACASALLIALVGCASGQPAQQQGNLDLGGGISMTADGAILGATPSQPSSFAESDYTFEPTRIALPAGAPVVRDWGAGPMKTAACINLLLAALLLGGCGLGPDGRSDAAATAQVNPYPPGAATPFFFRSASDWQQYAETKSAGAKPAD